MNSAEHWGKQYLFRVDEVAYGGENMETKVRLSGLDAIRGITLLSMIGYHACWDLQYLFGVELFGFGGIWTYFWQQSICWTFIFLSGFCWSLGRHHLKRGIYVFGAGLLITGVTLLVVPDAHVIFGVLTLIGSCMLLMIPLERLFRKVAAGTGFWMSMLLFLLFRNVNDQELGFGDWTIVTLPDLFYSNLLSTYLGFPDPDFYSADYFSLIPWGFLFVAGYFGYQFVEKKHLMQRLFSWKLPPFTAVGRYSLPVYLVHQPVVFGVLWIVCRLV